MKNLNRLLYFCSVAKRGSYSRAAEEANVTEPVVHRAVKDLEKSCGTRLLERVGGRVQLTQCGGVIFEYATQIAALADQVQQAVAEFRGRVSGSISIGAGMTIAPHLLPAVLPKWISEHPHVQVSIVEGKSEDLEKEVLEGRLDLIISPRTKWAPGLKREIVFSDKLVALSAPGHAFARRDLVRVADLSAERMILAPAYSSILREVEELGSQYGVQFRLPVGINRLDLVKPLCKAGVGIAILPMSAAVEEIVNRQLCLLNVEGFPRPRPYYAVYRTNSGLTPEMKSFLRAVGLWVREMHRRLRQTASLDGEATPHNP